jgi:glutaredoxin
MGQARVELFTRKGCHLCEDAREQLLALRAEVPFTLVETDVDSSYALKQAYGLRVPVVVFAGRCVSELRLAEGACADLRRALEGAR